MVEDEPAAGAATLWPGATAAEDRQPAAHVGERSDGACVT
jgi:hypothetical protein